jgi:hypothetical protein
MGGTGSGAGGSAGSGKGGGSATAGSAVLDTLSEVCPPYCQRIDSCQPNGPFPNCLDACRATDDLYEGSCLDKQIAEYACVASLPCSEVPTYVKDKGAHPVCGAVYQALAKTCQYNGGKPPGECLSFCKTAYGCRPDIVLPPEGCAQNCNEVLTGYDSLSGACRDAMKAAYACLGQVDCASITTLLEAQAMPAACAAHDSTIAAACR